MHLGWICSYSLSSNVLFGGGKLQLYLETFLAALIHGVGRYILKKRDSQYVASFYTCLCMSAFFGSICFSLLLSKLLFVRIVLIIVFALGQLH